jgi:hypothetical protein
MNGGWTVQFLPDQGLSKLMQRHNFLYSGPFADRLNLDIRYVPQLALARTATRQPPKALYEELNSNISRSICASRPLICCGSTAVR